MSLTGMKHREVRWRRATLPEAKMVLESYRNQQNLAMSFTVTVPAETKRKVNRQQKDSNALGNRIDMADVTLVPEDVTHTEASAAFLLGKHIPTSRRA